MTALVLAIVVFVLVGVGFLASNLILGWLIRPDNPTPEKSEIYECGEEPVGSAWNQFDLRFYVVALLFVIFDVEIAFLFPWAVVFGSSTKLADPQTVESQKQAAVQTFAPPGLSHYPVAEPEAYRLFSQFAFVEFLVFFGILMLGFAYLWHRGDLEWVRSTSGQSPEAPQSER